MEVKAAALTLIQVVTTEVRLKRALRGGGKYKRALLEKRVVKTYANGYDASLSVKLLDEQDDEGLYVEVSATFTHPEDLDPSILTNHKVLGTFYMLFPYVRSTVSSLQLMNGMVPITLPPLTLVGKVEESRVDYELYTLDLTDTEGSMENATNKVPNPD